MKAQSKRNDRLSVVRQDRWSELGRGAIGGIDKPTRFHSCCAHSRCSHGMSVDGTESPKTDPGVEGEKIVFRPAIQRGEGANFEIAYSGVLGRTYDSSGEMAAASKGRKSSALLVKLPEMELVTGSAGSIGVW